MQKAVLLTWLQNLVSEHLWVVNMLKAPKHWLILQRSIIVIFFDRSEIEKFCLSIIWNHGTVCYHTDTRSKVFSLSKSECLTQPVQMQLSKSRKVFSHFFLHFRNLRKVLNTLGKKMCLRG